MGYPLTLPMLALVLGTQQARPDHWAAFTGCWRAEPASQGETLCIAPIEDGVRMVTLVDGAVRAEARVITDGRARRVETDECTGTELAHWSADARRVFLTSELSCSGRAPRKVSGIFAVTTPSEWISVQSVEEDGKVATRTVRYRALDSGRVPAEFQPDRAAAAAARAYALRSIDGDAVSEAVRAVDAPAVQEWLNATGQPFQLDLEDSARAGTRVYTSALDFLGSPAPVQQTREVVHVVERPVYVTHRHVRIDRSCWSPWGYDHWGWRTYHGPAWWSVRIGPIVIRNGPILIGRVHDHYYDRYRYRDRYYRDRYYTTWDRDRFDRDRYERDRYEREREYRPRDHGGSVTRDGYRSRERAQPARPGNTTTTTITTTRERERSSSEMARAVERTRSASPVRIGESRDRIPGPAQQPRERTTVTRERAPSPPSEGVTRTREASSSGRTARPRG